ncbi:MAG TPA: hypothetical protein VHB98_08075 [Chloroflexota bacterium]|nr:hypothetical protein [Chloroflexota bacterium]
MQRSTRLFGAFLFLAGTLLATSRMSAGAASPPSPTTAAGSALHITPQGQVTQLAIDPRHTATLYAGTAASGIYRSDNGGATWVLAGKGLAPGLAVTGLVVDSSTAIFVATAKGVYKSTNQGRSWASAGPPTASPSTSVALDPTNPAVIYAGSQGDGIYRSTNAAGT